MHDPLHLASPKHSSREWRAVSQRDKWLARSRRRLVTSVLEQPPGEARWRPPWQRFRAAAGHCENGALRVNLELRKCIDGSGITTTGCASSNKDRLMVSSRFPPKPALSRPQAKGRQASPASDRHGPWPGCVQLQGAWPRPRQVDLPWGRPSPRGSRPIASVGGLPAIPPPCRCHQNSGYRHSISHDRQGSERQRC